MDRISTSTAVPDLFGAGKPGFRDGNKALGILPTDLNALLFNSIQEELMSVIEGAGLAADDADFTQLRQAIQAMIINGQKSVIIHDAVFEASVADGNAVYWHVGNGEFTKALADGSTAQNAVGFADVTNEKVYAFGAAPIFTGLTPGAYYLDGTTPGAITAVAPATNIVKLGLAVSATEIYVDIDAGYVITDASETQKGLIEIATSTEIQTGTDTTRAVTPEGLAHIVIGVGQTWQNVLGSRAAGVTYTNTTGRPILVNIVLSTGTAGRTFIVNGINVASFDNSGAVDFSSAIVPAGGTYSISGAASISLWSELR